MSTFAADQGRADRERAARRHLDSVGADTVPRQPWIHPEQPLSSVDLVQFAMWRTRFGSEAEHGTTHDLEAALTLMPSARSEIEHVETGLLFIARSHGMAWGRIARLLGLGSAQAAQQRFDRLSTRAGTDTRG